MTKLFPTEDVLSAATGYLATGNGMRAVYDVLEWATGQVPWTHQLPEMAKAFRPVLLKAHPELAQAYEEAKAVNCDNWSKIVAEWVQRYGPQIAAPQIGS